MKYFVILLLLNAPTLQVKALTDDRPMEFEVTIEWSNVTCPGLGNGYAEVIIEGNSGPYLINWSTGSTTAKIENLFAGTYIVEVSDSEGKNLLKGVTITEPQEISVSFQNRNLLCFGNTDGKVDMTVTGGTLPYSFSWSSGETSEDLDNINAGEYFITITDANNCTFNSSTTIVQPPALDIAYSTKSASCFAVEDGEIDLAVFGGTGPYFYSWSNGETTQDLFDLAAGEHTVTISDANNCQLTEVITVTQPDKLEGTLDVINVSCNGADGKINVSVNGGTGPFSYKWSNSTAILNRQTRDLDNLPRDQYEIVITDANSCEFNETVVVDENLIIEISPNVTHISCIDNDDGSINVDISGGQAPYAFLWSNGNTSNQIDALSPGAYSVVVADAGGCTSTMDINIEEPKDLIFEIITTKASCLDLADGRIDLFAGGGTAPYNYAWSNGATDANLDQLAADKYTVNVTDANGCEKEMSTEVKTKNRLCINIPNGFTPNGDTMNDTWILAQSEFYPNIKVAIFNRWGKLLFTSSGYSRPWDGTYKGKSVPAGTYYYTIDLGTAGQAEAGSVTIIK